VLVGSVSVIAHQLVKYAMYHPGTGFWAMVSAQGAAAAGMFFSIPVWGQVAALAVVAGIAAGSIYALGQWRMFY